MAAIDTQTAKAATVQRLSRGSASAFAGVTRRRGSYARAAIACASSRTIASCSTRRSTRRMRLGAYAAEGLEVELLPSPGPGRAEAALARRRGRRDVDGPDPHHEASRRQTPASPLIAFAEVVCRDPFSLVGATPNPGFRLADLLGKRFASTSEVPTPWLCLERRSARRRHRPGAVSTHHRPHACRRTSPRSPPADIDVAQLFEPFVEEAVAGGAACLAAGEHARPHQLHGVRHDARAPRRRPRAVPPHGAGDLQDPALGRRRNRPRRSPRRSPIISRRSTAAC